MDVFVFTISVEDLELKQVVDECIRTVFVKVFTPRTTSEKIQLSKYHHHNRRYDTVEPVQLQTGHS